MSLLFGLRLRGVITGVPLSTATDDIKEHVRGVITGVPLSTSTDDIKEHVRGGRMTETKRLISRKEGLRSESLSMLLRFEKVLPGKVQIEFLNFNVRELLWLLL
jgi:hypothetical protein